MVNFPNKLFNWNDIFTSKVLLLFLSMTFKIVFYKNGNAL